MRRFLTTLLAKGALLALAGCESPGFSALEAEQARQRGEVGFAVLEADDDRALFAANGRQVAVEPPEGYCLDEESVAVTRRSAFALVADCMASQEAALANGGTGEDLPRPFPGILTITVSGDEAFGDAPGALSAFESLLGTEAGGRLLGRGDGAAPGRIVTAQRVDGSLYVLVEEVPAEAGGSILAPRFWRSFTEINDRLVLVTVSCFDDRPLSDDEMLSFLEAQMAELREANGMPPSAGAEAATAVLETLEAARPAEVAEATGGATPMLAPMPPRRPG